MTKRKNWKAWSKEDDKHLEENYLTEDVNKISKKLDRTVTAIIQRATITLGIKKSGLPENVTIDDLVRKYKELQSIRKVGKVFGIHGSKVGYYLKKAGAINKPTRHTCNDNYFQSDSPDVFYWAGFIAADGCVKLHSGKYKQLSIGLTQKDHMHLEKFKISIEFTGPVSKCNFSNDKYSKSEITISSKQIFDDLARFNIVPRKSLVYTFPEWLIDHPLVNHFMRGYNDGDGSFYIPKLANNRTTNQLYISLRGTKKFLTTYKQILERHCNVKKSDKKPRLNSGIYALEYGGTRAVVQIRDFLYKGAGQNKLERKYKIAYNEQFINLPIDYKHKKVIGTNLKTGEEIYFDSMKDTEKEGFCRAGVSGCCRGKSKYHKGYTWRYQGEDPKDTSDIKLTRDIAQKRWNERDKEYLKQNYETGRTVIIAKALERTDKSIVKMAKKLGLRKKTKDATKHMKSIVGTNVNTGEKIKFDSIKEACENGFCKPHLHRSLKGIVSHHKNYTWKYA